MVFLAKTKGNKYTRLMVNTVIFGIGQFSSKILVFIMLPIYTGYLTTAEYGTVDLIQQSANVLWPVITLGITNGIIRIGLDPKLPKKRCVFHRHQVLSSRVRRVFSADAGVFCH